MPKMNVDEKVKVRLDTSSPYRGRPGVISEILNEDSYGSWYMVKFESKGFSTAYRFNEKDLEKIISL
jgi:hypothetical protein